MLVKTSKATMGEWEEEEAKPKRRGGGGDGGEQGMVEGTRLSEAGWAGSAWGSLMKQGGMIGIVRVFGRCEGSFKWKGNGMV